jgi:hypothetical protein
VLDQSAPTLTAVCAGPIAPSMTGRIEVGRA